MNHGKPWFFCIRGENGPRIRSDTEIGKGSPQSLNALNPRGKAVDAAPKTGCSPIGERRKRPTGFFSALIISEVVAIFSD